MAALPRTFRVPYPRDDDMSSLLMRRNLPLYGNPTIPPFNMSGYMAPSILWRQDVPDEPGQWSSVVANASLLYLPPPPPPPPSVPPFHSWYSNNDDDIAVWSAGVQPNVALLDPPLPPPPPSVNMSITTAGGATVTISVNGIPWSAA